MNFEKISGKILSCADECKDRIISHGRAILEMPETGYTENKTSAYIRSVFESLGLECSTPWGITGVKATLKGRCDGPDICIIGEMDAVICKEHPKASNAGCAHACGHNAQIAAMLGAAEAIVKSDIMSELCGSITFFAVPAEEFIELDRRKQLKDDGKISCYGGKQQLIAEGAFDNADIAMMIHAQPDEPEAKMYVRGYNLGFVAKTITFLGKATHGSTPQYGTNALNAAALAIIGIHSNRDTFTDEDRIRIHPIITKGGDVVNSVPDEVCIDTYVRGATPEAIKKGCIAVERSVEGAATMIGARAITDTIPGYLPIAESRELSEVFEENTAKILGESSLVYGKEITGSTDIGDLSMIMPVIQPSIGGFTGSLHSKEFAVSDENTAYVSAAKILAVTSADLLNNNAEKAKKVIAAFRPTMTKEEYINYLGGK